MFYRVKRRAWDGAAERCLAHLFGTAAIKGPGIPATQQGARGLRWKRRAPRPLIWLSIERDGWQRRPGAASPLRAARLSKSRSSVKRSLPTRPGSAHRVRACPSPNWGQQSPFSSTGRPGLAVGELGQVPVGLRTTGGRGQCGSGEALW
ncbi:hypothetical protein NDU88_002941 [Pleurodeles waltl]|uniref:Uncharacterized protein n=1 Tax=Pleurodeles waltl TaxID=8319 RepID=A0AAV7TNA1_PLEWA|nr:hypothetical protein NDU88_002941 [Pleurodeles waltl]